MILYRSIFCCYKLNLGSIWFQAYFVTLPLPACSILLWGKKLSRFHPSCFVPCRPIHLLSRHIQVLVSRPSYHPVEGRHLHPCPSLETPCQLVLVSTLVRWLACLLLSPDLCLNVLRSQGLAPGLKSIGRAIWEKWIRLGFCTYCSKRFIYTFSVYPEAYN